MGFEIILADGSIELIHISSTTYKNWNVWRIKFTDGREAMLYKIGKEWVQRYEDQLDIHALLTIGECIDSICIENKLMN